MDNYFVLGAYHSVLVYEKMAVNEVTESKDTDLLIIPQPRLKTGVNPFSLVFIITLLVLYVKGNYP